MSQKYWGKALVITQSNERILACLAYEPPPLQVGYLLEEGVFRVHDFQIALLRKVIGKGLFHKNQIVINDINVLSDQGSNFGLVFFF